MAEWADTLRDRGSRLGGVDVPGRRRATVISQATAGIAAVGASRTQRDPLGLRCRRQEPPPGNDLQGIAGAVRERMRHAHRSVRYSEGDCLSAGQRRC